MNSEQHSIGGEASEIQRIGIIVLAIDWVTSRIVCFYFKKKEVIFNSTCNVRKMEIKKCSNKNEEYLHLLITQTLCEIWGVTKQTENEGTGEENWNETDGNS